LLVLKALALKALAIELQESGMFYDEALTAEEVAERLRVSRNLVYELRKRGELQGYTVGRKLRFSAEEVRLYIERCGDCSQESEVGGSGASDPTFSTRPQPSSAARPRRGLRSATTTPTLLPPLPSPPPASSFQSPAAQAGDCFVVNGADAIMDMLANYLIQMNISMLRSHLTSYEGLAALYLGSVDATSVHLWDGETSTYNAPYIRRLAPRTPCALIHIASRMQGLIVAKGNPLAIAGWEDLLRPDVAMANCPKGSGARVLLDEKLSQLNAGGRLPRGYDAEISSPIMLAGRVANKRVDAVVGTEKMARQVMGVDFIPLQKERFELAVRQADRGALPVRAMLNTLESKLLRGDISGFPGLDTSEMGSVSLI
jgi:putative molybdopterin biosynthesis protein